MEFFSGIGLGFVIATLIGPVFFSLIQTSIKNGITKAIFMAIGISLSDAIYIFLTYFGLAQFSENPFFIKFMGVGGGILLIITGLVALFKKKYHFEEIPDELTHKDKFRYFMKGFTLNVINPAVLLFWVGSVGVVSLKYSYQNLPIALFFTGTVFTIFATDCLKIYVAVSLKRVLNDQLLYWVNKLAGVLMISFGVKLLWGAYF